MSDPPPEPASDPVARFSDPKLAHNFAEVPQQASQPGYAQPAPGMTAGLPRRARGRRLLVILIAVAVLVVAGAITALVIH